MTDIVHLGDYCPDGRGGVVRGEGAFALLNEALIRLTCRRGSFPLLPELGSRLYLLPAEKPSARNMAARQYAAEALAGMDVTVTDAAVTPLDGGVHVQVLLASGGREMTLEVNT